MKITTSVVDWLVTLSLLSIAVTGCGAASPAPRMVRANDLSDLSGVDVRVQPIVVEFMPGDVVPLTLQVAGDFVGTPPDLAPLNLVVKRHFYAKLSKAGFELSLDGVRYGDKVAPGSIMFGFGLSREGPHANLVLTTAKLKDPAP